MAHTDCRQVVRDGAAHRLAEGGGYVAGRQVDGLGFQPVHHLRSLGWRQPVQHVLNTCCCRGSFHSRSKNWRREGTPPNAPTTLPAQSPEGSGYTNSPVLSYGHRYCLFNALFDYSDESYHVNYQEEKNYIKNMFII